MISEDEAHVVPDYLACQDMIYEGGPVFYNSDEQVDPEPLAKALKESGEPSKDIS